MNTVYEALRTLLRNKELEIKKLEKEIEALRIVLPIVAEAGDAVVDPNTLPSFDAPRPAAETAKPKPSLAGPDFENVMAQVKTVAPTTPPAPVRGPIAEAVPAKPRTSWP